MLFGAARGLDEGWVGGTDILRKLRNTSDGKKKKKSARFPPSTLLSHTFIVWSLACLTCFFKEPNAVPVLLNVLLVLTWQEDAKYMRSCDRAHSHCVAAASENVRSAPVDGVKRSEGVLQRPCRRLCRES